MKTIDTTATIQLNTQEESKQSLQDKCALLTQHKRFGVSSEKSNTRQLSIFNVAEQEAQAKQEEPKMEEISYKKAATKRKKPFTNSR